MALETGRPAADIREARKIMKKLRRVRPLERDSDGHVLDQWYQFRRAGLVVEGKHLAETVIVKTPDGREITMAVKKAVELNNGRDTLFYPEDRAVITQIFPKPARRV